MAVLTVCNWTVLRNRRGQWRGMDARSLAGYSKPWRHVRPHPLFRCASRYNKGRGNPMKITYTGRQVELKQAQLKKLEAQFSKTGKLLDGKRECETHVILSLERHLHNAEATVTYYGHQLVGVGSD